MKRGGSWPFIPELRVQSEKKTRRGEGEGG